MHTLRALADTISSVRAADLTSEARTAALRCVLDLMSAVLAGFHAPSVAGTRQVAREVYGSGESAIWFAGVSSTAVGAAFCNSAAACVLDLDDGHRIARGHPGASVIPATLGAAAAARASVEDLLTAIVIGYEICVRIAAARSVNARTGVWGGYGAVAAAGWLRGTPPEKLAHALAISGMTAPHLLSTSGGPRYPAPLGNDIKEGIPWATVTALTALHLAEVGLAGPQDILDHAPHYDSRRVLDGIGGGLAMRRPMICETYFKPYACCRHIHAPVDAFDGLMRRHAIRPADIECVDVHVYSGALLISNRREPRNLVDVQFSIPYCLGLVAILGPSCLLPMAGDVLNRADAAAIAARVELHLDDTLNARFPAESLCRVVVTTPQGRFESPVTAPRGEASDPMSWDDLCQKFRTATRSVIPVARQDAVLGAVDRLAQGDLSPLLRELALPIAHD